MENQNLKHPVKLVISFVMILISTSSIAFAQAGSVIQDVDMLEKHKTVLMEDYPNLFTEVEIVDVQRISERHSKVFYKKGNQQFEAVVNSDRQDMLLVATSRVLNVNEVPNIVMDAFRSSKYKKWNIEKTFEVTTPYSSLFYRIDVSRKKRAQDKMKVKSLFYSHLGQYKKSPY